MVATATAAVGTEATEATEAAVGTEATEAAAGMAGTDTTEDMRRQTKANSSPNFATHRPHALKSRAHPEVNFPTTYNSTRVA